MSFLAVGLVLASCGVHALWNLLLKRAANKLAFTALFLLVVPIAGLPAFLLLLPHVVIPRAGWFCVAGTGAAYFGYYIALAIAYEEHELSVVYPLSRGLGPVFALLGGMALLHERPTALGVLGVAMIVGGVFALHWQGGPSDARPGFMASASGLAIFVGLMNSVYSLIDKFGVGHLRIPPPAYIYLTFTLSALLVVPWAVWREGGEAVLAEWRSGPGIVLAVGVFHLAAYLLVLYAMALPNSPASYIVPLRTTSALFGVVLGVGVLREEGLAAKLGAAAIMMAGIAVMTWGG